MLEAGLLQGFAFAIIAALLGGIVARWLRQPTVLGYIVAGVVIGPHTPGPVQSVEQVRILADFGVAFLLFGLGTQVSIDQLRRLQGAALIAACVQVGLMVAVALVVAAVLALPLLVSGLFALMAAQSSSAVIVKILGERGETESLFGRFATGVSVGQDLLSIPVIVLLPSLGEPPERIVPAVLMGVAMAIGLTIVFYVVGARLLPALLERIALLGRELFLLAVVSLALGTALLLERAGLSLALGAFLAGLVIGESHLNRQALVEVLPLRDIFATFFFTSVGMLLDVQFVIENPLAVLGVLGLVIGGKFVICSVIPLVLRYPFRTAVLAGVALAQIGEFAFLLAQLSLNEGIISADIYSLVLAGAVLSIAINPLLLEAAEGFFRVLPKVPVLGWLGAGDDGGHQARADLPRGHVVLCGYNVVGQRVVQELALRGVPFVVIDPDPGVLLDLRRSGVPSVGGDPANPVVLAQAGVRQAKAVAVMTSDIPTTESIIRHVRRLNPHGELIVRGVGEDLVAKLADMGAHKVVRPDFEMSQEFLRLLLQAYGYTAVEVENLLLRRREGRDGGQG